MAPWTFGEGALFLEGQRRRKCPIGDPVRGISRRATRMGNRRDALGPARGEVARCSARRADCRKERSRFVERRGCEAIRRSRSFQSRGIAGSEAALVLFPFTGDAYAIAQYMMRREGVNGRSRSELSYPGWGRTPYSAFLAKSRASTFKPASGAKRVPMTRAAAAPMASASQS